jgi:hypothetical protein
MDARIIMTSEIAAQFRILRQRIAELEAENARLRQLVALVGFDMLLEAWRRCPRCWEMQREVKCIRCWWPATESVMRDGSIGG